MPTVIELGVAARWEPPAAPAKPPRPRRWLAVPLAFALLVAPLGGSVPRRPLVPAFTLDGAVLDFLARGDSLYVARYAEPRGTLVEAYRFPGGRQRWSRVLAPGTRLVHAGESRLTVSDDDVAGTGPALSGLDTASGRTVWTRQGYQQVAVTETVVLGAPEQSRAGVIPGVVGFASEDGAVRWSAEMSAGSRTGQAPDIGFAPAPATSVAVVLPDGTVQERDVETGDLRWNVRVDMTWPVRGLLVVGDVAILYPMSRGEPDPATPMAVDLGTGRILWRAEWTARLGPCGGALCDLAESGTRALDPRTGRPLWQQVDWHFTGTLDERHIVLTAGTGTTATTPGPAVVLDAWTGRRVRELGTWRVLGSTSGTAIVQRLAADGTSLISRVDIGTGARTLVGVWESWIPAPRCRATEVFVACAGTARVAVW